MISLLLVINGCALTPPNVPLCREKDIDRGRCTNIVDGKSFDINELEKFKDEDGQMKTWYELRPYFILMPISSWAQLKAWILKVCEKYKNCGNQNADAEVTVKNVDGILQD